jgi:hypothetical protein
VLAFVALVAMVFTNLEVACVYAGILGVAALYWRVSLSRRAARPRELPANARDP